jgi:hypothetical protein
LRDLDLASLPALSWALASIAGDGDIYVDLAGLEFIDVGCLRALVVAAARLTDGHVLTLRSAPPPMRRLLEVTGWRGAPRLCLQGPASALSVAPAAAQAGRGLHKGLAAATLA